LTLSRCNASHDDHLNGSLDISSLSKQLKYVAPLLLHPSDPQLLRQSIARHRLPLSLLHVHGLQRDHRILQPPQPLLRLRLAVLDDAEQGVEMLVLLPTRAVLDDL